MAQRGRPPHPLHRWIEQQRWVHSAGKNGDQVRGLYWGNYLGPKILTRLGDRQMFLKKFREQARNYDKRPNAQVWEFPHGVFVSLCLDPLGCRPDGHGLHIVAQHNLLWLNREFGTNGVLKPW